MPLDGLRIYGFRNILNADLSFESTRIVISGDNGSGKTSLLESIFLAANGRSFRSNSPRKLLQHGCDDGFRIDCFYVPSDEQSLNRLSARYDNNSLTFSLNNAVLGSRSELSQLIPCRYLGPRVQDLVIGSPKLRRAFLDWGLFHVKHIPINIWSRYKKAVHLRVASLRASLSDRVLEGIELDIVRCGSEIANSRRQYCDLLDFNAVNFRTGLDLSFEYRDVFLSDDKALSALKENRSKDTDLGYQTIGPHRADLVIRHQGRIAREQLSSGQSKLLAITLLLIQFQNVRSESGSHGILLVDDMSAELAKSNQDRVWDLLSLTESQVISTTTNNAEKHPEMFHVEHGKVSPVV